MTATELRELDAAVAVEVMGHANVRHEPDHVWEWLRALTPKEIEYYSQFGVSHEYLGLEYYSSDIAAAWQVFEKMVPDREMDHWRRAIEQEGEKWVAGILFWSEKEPDVPRWLIFSSAKTAPLSICLAALKAVRAGKEGAK